MAGTELGGRKSVRNEVQERGGMAGTGAGKLG